MFLQSISISIEDVCFVFDGNIHFGVSTILLSHKLIGYKNFMEFEAKWKQYFYGPRSSMETTILCSQKLNGNNNFIEPEAE